MKNAALDASKTVGFDMRTGTCKWKRCFRGLNHLSSQHRGKRTAKAVRRVGIKMLKGAKVAKSARKLLCSMWFSYLCILMCFDSSSLTSIFSIGRYINSTGSSACTNCLPGSFGDSNGLECHLCSKGMYSNTAGQPSCLVQPYHISFFHETIPC